MQELTQKTPTIEKAVEASAPEKENDADTGLNTASLGMELAAPPTPPNATKVAQKIQRIPDTTMRQSAFRSYQQTYGNRFATQIARIIQRETTEQTPTNSTVIVNPNNQMQPSQETPPSPPTVTPPPQSVTTTKTESSDLTKSKGSYEEHPEIIKQGGDQYLRNVTTKSSESTGKWETQEKSNNDKASEKERRSKIESTVKSTTEEGTKTVQEQTVTGPNKKLTFSSDKTETFQGTRDVVQNKDTQYPDQNILGLSASEKSSTHTVTKGSEDVHTVTTPEYDEQHDVTNTKKDVTTKKYGSEQVNTTTKRTGLSGYGAKAETNYTSGFGENGLRSYSRNYTNTQQGYTDPVEQRDAELTTIKLDGGKSVKVGTRNVELSKKVQGTVGYNSKTKYGQEGHSLDVEYGAGAKGEATGSVKVGKDGATAKGSASVRAGLYGEASAKQSLGKYASVSASGKALVGGEASTNGEIGYVTGKGATISGQASAFAGAKVEGGVTGSVGYGDYQFLVVSAKGQASAGIGGSANFTVSYKDGKFKIGAGLAATLGLGVGASTEVTFSPAQLAMALGKGAYDSRDAIKKYCLVIKKAWNELSWAQIYAILEQAATVYGNAIYDYMGISSFY